MATADKLDGHPGASNDTPTQGATEEVTGVDAPQQEAHVPLMSIEMPVESVILTETIRLASDPNTHITDVSTCVSQDPIFVLELLRVANQSTTAQARPAVTIAQNAVVQLGTEKVLEITTHIAGRSQITDPVVAQIFERLRSQGRRCSIIAKILAMAIRKDYAGEAQTAGLMTSIGHMLACRVLGRVYADLALSVPRATLVYRLANEHHFDVRLKQLQYLQRNSFPESLLFALDRDATPINPQRAALRALVESAVELVNAFDVNKWDRYKPGSVIPTNSSIRLLQLNEQQYEKVYERCHEYLINTQALEQKKEEAARMLLEQRNEAADPTLEPAESPAPPAPQVILNESAEELPRAVKPDTTMAEGGQGWSFSDILFPAPPPLVFERMSSTDLESGTEFFQHNKAAKALMDELSQLCDTADTTGDMVSRLLEFLVEKQLFARVALLAVAPNRRTAKVLKAAGAALETDEVIKLSDPLSPVAACTTKVKSFNARGIEDLGAPLGVSSYAISPIDVRYEVPIVLYADCGPEGAMSFELRRMFRYVLGYVNSRLPDAAGQFDTVAP